ncbi:MAG: serine/threonine-protein kinase, partial [Polyangia bacterium]|nr:serine/threonine-protein kinase [Polyangia bacterium]
METKPKKPGAPVEAQKLGGEDWVIEFDHAQGGRTGDTQVYGATVMSESLIRAAKAVDHGATVSLDLQDLEEVADLRPRPGQGERAKRATKAMGTPQVGRAVAQAPSAIPAPPTTQEVVDGAFGASSKVDGFQLSPGIMVHKYELIRKLGRGGMGTVWAAHDTRLGRKVAIKFLHSKASKKKEFRERFLAEARATAQFNHEAIVTIHDAGEYSGMSYLVLEYLEGEPLTNRLKDRRIPYHQAIQIMIPVVKALTVAHGVGIIHRDLKPDNVYVLQGGGVKVLDFGLAKLFDTEASADGEGEQRSDLLTAQLREAGLESHMSTESGITGGLSGLSGSKRTKLHDGEEDLTRAGTIMGTYAYMSPEQ